MRNKPILLLISNSLDYATDYVVADLIDRGVDYYRLDLDLLSMDRVSLDPISGVLRVTKQGDTVTIDSASVRSVFFRAPTHLRESRGDTGEPDALLARHQWTAFARSLMVFERSKWINHPASTYRAENKPFQLMVASQIGFNVPETYVTNATLEDKHKIWNGKSVAAIKALDSFLLRVAEEEEAFFYTQQVRFRDLHDDALAMMPVILQRYLDRKTDLRVTIVGEQCFAAEITTDGCGVSGDWRLRKEEVQFTPVELPDEIRECCIRLARRLELVVVAIDLAKIGEKYFFLEVNPTGEWGWLVSESGLAIDHAIVDELLC